MTRQDKELVVDNSEIYMHYRERLKNIAIAQFEWHGLPETCDRLYFERALLNQGSCDRLYIESAFLNQGSAIPYFIERRLKHETTR